MERLRGFSGAIILSLLLTGLATPAFAQGTPRAELSAGYQYLRLSQTDIPDEMKDLPAGWYLDVAGNISRTFGIVGQVGGNYKTVDTGFGDADFNLHNFMVGARVSGRRNPNVTPFGQVLGGGVRHKISGPGFSEEGTDGAVQVGVGVNITGGAVGFRLGADYMRIFSEDEGVNVFRLAVGIVVRFGR